MSENFGDMDLSEVGRKLDQKTCPVEGRLMMRWYKTENEEGVEVISLETKEV